MPDVSYIIRIEDGTGSGGQNPGQSASVNLNSGGKKGIAKAIGAKAAGAKAGASAAGGASVAGVVVAAAAIAIKVLNELDNIRISLISTTTGNETYQRYQESIKNDLLGTIRNPLSIGEKFINSLKNEYITSVKRDLDRITTREFNVRAGAMGNRAPRKQ